MGNPLGDPDMRVSFSTLQRRVKELERRRTPGRPAAPPRTLAELEDVDVTGVADAEVLTYDGTLEKWVRGDPPLTGDWTIGAWTDDGLFDETSPFEFSQGVVVDPMSAQLVIVTAECTGISDILLSSGGDPVVLAPAPWILGISDYTADPDGDDATGATGVGAVRIQASLWAVNNTDTAVSHTILARAGAATTAYELDATVEITIRTANRS